MVKTVDFESMTMFTLIIEARDGGSPSRTATAELKINIIDVNEHSPVITNLPSTTSVPEGEAAGYEVFTVLATDADTSDVLTFTIDAGVPFAIDSNNGKITTTEVLDRETKDSYTVRVTVSDGTFTDVEDLTVTVSDMNDNKPVFTNINKEVSVSENEPIGFEVETVEAKDDDSGSNAMIVYSIISGNDDDIFEIDTVSILQNDF